MDDLSKYIDEQLQNKEFAEEWEKTRPEFEIMRSLIAARQDQHMTQKELSKLSGVRQSNISRIECGESIPNISTLAALAKGLGKELHIRFE